VLRLAPIGLSPDFAPVLVISSMCIVLNEKLEAVETFSFVPPRSSDKRTSRSVFLNFLSPRYVLQVKISGERYLGDPPQHVILGAASTFK